MLDIHKQSRVEIRFDQSSRGVPLQFQDVIDAFNNTLLSARVSCGVDI